MSDFTQFTDKDSLIGNQNERPLAVALFSSGPNIINIYRYFTYLKNNSNRYLNVVLLNNGKTRRRLSFYTKTIHIYIYILHDKNVTCVLKSGNRIQEGR